MQKQQTKINVKKNEIYKIEHLMKFNKLLNYDFSDNFINFNITSQKK